ncbi:DUF4625 domain-containing protein [Empedobacter falsenii]
MKNTILKYIFVSIVALFVTSCSSDDSSLDTTKPEINLIAPKDHDEFHLGETFTIDAILKDNIELGAVKIEIHSAEDGHEHRTANVNWTYDAEEAIPAGKTEHTLSHQVNIPAEGITEGHYHLGLFLIDRAGNQTQSFIEIVVGEDHDHEH